MATMKKLCLKSTTKRPEPAAILIREPACGCSAGSFFLLRFRQFCPLAGRFVTENPRRDRRIQRSDVPLLGNRNS